MSTGWRRKIEVQNTRSEGGSTIPVGQRTRLGVDTRHLWRRRERAGASGNMGRLHASREV